MIIGPCPYCDKVVFTPIAPNCPAFSKETCEECGRKHWVFHSRIEPGRYTLKEFKAKFIVDEATKQIKERGVER